MDRSLSASADAQGAGPAYSLDYARTGKNARRRHRLGSAGASDRDCQVLLRHARKGITRQYMAPEVARLMQAAEAVLNTERQGTIPLTIIRRKVA